MVQFDYDNASTYDINNPKRIDLAKVDDVTPADIGLTPYMIKKYMFGLKIVDPDTKQELDDSVYEHLIDTKIPYAEQQLGIAILPRIIANERHDYYANDFMHYNYIQTYERPILQVNSVEMMYNNQRLEKFPTSWLKVYTRTGEIEVNPAVIVGDSNVLNGGEAYMNGTQAISSAPLWGLPGIASTDVVPQALQYTYVAGMLPPTRRGITRDWEVPLDLVQLIAKYVLRELLEIWGDLIIGAGIAGESLSVDGISESTTTTQSAMYTGGAARIKLIDDTIASLEQGLRNRYGYNKGNL
jgi:hypothetical protein